MLSLEEVRVVDRLAQFHSQKWGFDERLDRYHDGRNRLATLGLAVPPELDTLETVVNWPRVAVEAIVERSDVKTLRRTGELDADSGLLVVYEANNLDA